MCKKLDSIQSNCCFLTDPSLLNHHCFLLMDDLTCLLKTGRSKEFHKKTINVLRRSDSKHFGSSSKRDHLYPMMKQDTGNPRAPGLTGWLEVYENDVNYAIWPSWSLNLNPAECIREILHQNTREWFNTVISISNEFLCQEWCHHFYTVLLWLISHVTFGY